MDNQITPISNAYYDVAAAQFDDGSGDLQYLADVNTFSMGFGATSMRADKQGMWLGAPTFAQAPFSVDMNGNLTLRTANNAITISSQTNQIIFYDNGIAQIGIGNV